MQMITSAKRRSENIRAASSKRGQDNILNKLLAHSQEFHYSNLSFASAGPALDLSNHRKIAQLKQLTWADAQQDRNSFQKERVLCSYGILFRGTNRDARQQHATLPLEEHPPGPSRGPGFGHHPTNTAAAAGFWWVWANTLVSSYRKNNAVWHITSDRLPNPIPHLSISEGWREKINLLTKWWCFWSLCPIQSSLNGRESRPRIMKLGKTQREKENSWVAASAHSHWHFYQICLELLPPWERKILSETQFKATCDGAGNKRLQFKGLYGKTILQGEDFWKRLFSEKNSRWNSKGNKARNW